MTYLTVKERTVAEEVVRGSRFITVVAPISDEAEAEALLEEVRRQHPDATHNCWAYRLGEVMRFSDDGEPGGTAGRPMLEVILKRDLDRVAAVVTRYFGGTRLGAGGLVRAYGGAVAKTLDVAGVVRVEPRVTLAVSVPFAASDTTYRLLDDWPGLRRLDQAFTPEGPRVLVDLPRREVEEFSARLNDATRGAATVEETET